MLIDISFLVIAIVCFSLLIYNKVEHYRLMYDLGLEKEVEERLGAGFEGVRKLKKRLSGGAKYGYGSDYDRIKQKRAKGSIRDTGEEN